MENYFILLGLEEKFDLNDTEIKEKYIQTQQKSHPDNISGDLEKSALINEAYLELLDPLKRAKHLFDLNKISISSGSMKSETLQLMQNPGPNFKKRLSDLGKYLEGGDLQAAYLAWCDCKYLERILKNT